MNFFSEWFNLTPLFLVKMFVLFFEVLYLVFAVILVRQEKLMRQIIEVPSSLFLRVLINANLVAAALLLVISLFLL